jgi:hypothetical protein
MNPDYETHIREAIKAGKGALAKIIQSMQASDVTPEIAKQLKKIYANTINKADCPCGSGNSFHGCCKPDFTLLVVEEKKQAKQERKEQKEITWVAQLGFGDDGQVVIRPPVQGKPAVDLATLTKLFQDAANELQMDLTVQRSIQAIQELAKRAAQQNGQMPGGPNLVGM